MNREELLNQLYENVDALKRVMHGKMHDLVGDLPISRSQMELLSILKYIQPTSPKLLADKMRLTPGAISQLIEGLVLSNLVVREVDPTDRRAQTIRISASGTKKILEIEKKRYAIMKNVIESLTTKELQVLLHVQEKLTKQFAEVSKDKETSK